MERDKKMIDNILGIILASLLIACGIGCFMHAAIDIKEKEITKSKYWLAAGVLFFILGLVTFFCASREIGRKSLKTTTDIESRQFFSQQDEKK